MPCTPLGCLMLLKDRLGDLSGLEAVVVGRSNIVGKPMAQLLLRENCTVTIAHSRTRDLPDVVRRADIVVAAVGRPEMVKGDWLKPGATVIDVGINRVDGKLVGDVDFASAQRGRRRDHAGAGRGRADDHRRAAAQHAGRGLHAGRACRRRKGCDRAVRLRLRHLPGGDRSAGLRADLRQPHPGRRRRRTAAPWRVRSVLVAAGILLFFALLGEDLLRALGISLSAFRIAGGIMLFLIAIDMVFEKRTERRENRAQEVSAQRGRGHFGLPDGDPDDRRSGLDRLGHAADGAQRRPAPVAGRARRAARDPGADPALPCSRPGR